VKIISIKITSSDHLFNMNLFVFIFRGVHSVVTFSMCDTFIIAIGKT
jgi:hypothetical protein